MTQIEKFKRWAEKQGWFLTYDGGDTFTYLLPSGRGITIDLAPNGDIVIEEENV